MSKPTLQSSLLKIESSRIDSWGCTNDVGVIDVIIAGVQHYVFEILFFSFVNLK